jgi:hypothetical protein
MKIVGLTTYSMPGSNLPAVEGIKRTFISPKCALPTGPSHAALASGFYSVHFLPPSHLLLPAISRKIVTRKDSPRYTERKRIKLECLVPLNVLEKGYT